MVATVRMVFGVVACVAAILAAAGCGLLESSTSPTPTENPTETFSGTLAPQGTSMFTFTVTQAGSVSVTLTSLSSPSTAGVGLAIGTPSGTTTCTASSSTPNAVAGSAPQITVAGIPGPYCVKLYDTGSLTAAATFTIHVTHS